MCMLCVLGCWRGCDVGLVMRGSGIVVGLALIDPVLHSGK